MTKSIVYFVINANIHLNIGWSESMKFMYIADKYQNKKGKYKKSLHL